MKSQITVREENGSEEETFNYVIYVTNEEKELIIEKCENYGDESLTVSDSDYSDEDIIKMDVAYLNDYMPFIAPYKLDENALADWNDFGDCFYKGCGLTKLSKLDK